MDATLILAAALGLAAGCVIAFLCYLLGHARGLLDAQRALEDDRLELGALRIASRHEYEEPAA